MVDRQRQRAVESGPSLRPGGLGPLVDSHCHLNHPRLLRRLEEVLARAGAAGVSQMIVVGYDLPSSRKAVELAEASPGIWAAVGVHPHEAAGVTASETWQLRSLASSGRVVAVGETGLDFYRHLSPAPAQRESFQRHLDLAAELDLPVIIHCRDAQEAVLEIAQPRARAGLIWHCFDGNLEQARRALGMGMVLGFGGLVMNARADELRAAAARVPPDRLLLETDAPYLAPPPLKGRDNEPANLAILADFLAGIRRDDPSRLAAATTANAVRVFGLGDGSA